MDSQDPNAGNGGGGNPTGAADRMPKEFKDLLAAIDTELGGHLQALSARVGYAGTAQRETLRRLDSLLENWGLRLQNQYHSVHQRCDAIQRQYEGVAQQLEDSQRRYDSAREEMQSLRQLAQGLQQQFEATQQQCQSVLGYEQQFRAHAQLTEQLDKLRTAVTSGRRREWLAIAAAVLALVVAGYFGLGKLGWSPVAGSIGSWLPG